MLVDSTASIIWRDEVKDYLLSRHNQTGAAPREGAPATEDTDQG